MSEAIKPIRLQINAQEASPAPPIGSTLAPKGLKVVEFCQDFNKRTKDFIKGTPLSVKILIKKNKSYTFEISQPLTSYLLKTAAKIEKGSAEPNKNKVGYLTRAQIQSIAEQKMSDLNAGSLEAAIRILSGSARSMGIQIREEE